MGTPNIQFFPFLMCIFDLPIPKNESSFGYSPTGYLVISSLGCLFRPDKWTLGVGRLGVGGFPCPLLVKQKQKAKTNKSRKKQMENWQEINSATRRKATKRMVTNRFEKRNFMQPMGRLNMPLYGLVFFLLGMGWDRLFGFSSFFPISSPQVPKSFLRCSQ